MPGKAVVTDLPESLRPFVSRKLAILRDVGVTPALARDALEYGRREMLATGLWRELRPLSEKVVAQLAKDMRSGRFVSPRASLDGPGLFDSVQVGYSDQLSNPFVLVDGRHRMMAATRVPPGPDGVVFRCDVVVGVDVDGLQGALEFLDEMTPAQFAILKVWAQRVTGS